MRSYLHSVIASAIIALTACKGDDRQSGRAETPTTEDATQVFSAHTPIPQSAPTIRVRLQRVSGSLEPVEFGPSGQLIQISESGDKTITRRAPFQILRDEKGWLLRGAEAFPSDFIVSDFLSLQADRLIEIRDDAGETRRYSGQLRCHPVRDREKVIWDVIEHVGIEAYLPGVLAGELYGHWGKQCQAAQAIAARSYVVMECHERAHKSWDVVDTPASQAYLGHIVDPVSEAACRLTSGMILTWGKDVVPGYFSSCCGGRSATATEAIGPNPINALPPLRGHEGDGYCQRAPLFTWRRTVNGDTLAAGLRARAHSQSPLHKLAGIQSITIADRNQHGRGVELTLKDSKGHTYLVSAKDLMSASSVLDRGPLYSGWVEGETSRKGLDLSGHGYGHGAGLCQYGAAAMDNAGKSFWEIIEYYYPGAEIKKAW